MEPSCKRLQCKAHGSDQGHSVPTWSPPASPRLPATRLHARNLTQSQPRTPGGVLVAVPVPRNTSPRTRTRQRCAGTLEPALEHFFVTPRSFLVATNRRNCTSAPQHLSSHSPQARDPRHGAWRTLPRTAWPLSREVCIQSFRSSQRKSFPHAGAPGHGSEFCGDIARHASLEAGGWCRRWQALCEVPVPEYTCAFPVSLCSLSVHFVCALWLLPYGMIP